MKYKAIIFDLDGVICFTDKYHYLAWKKIADEIGVFFDEQVNNRLRGVNREESLNIILESYQGVLTDTEKSYYTDKKNFFYREYLQEMSNRDLSPEVKSTMDTLKENGVKLAIGSSSKNAKLILEKLGLENYFDAISDGNSIVKAKPDPEIFLRASKILGITPKDCLVVEDAVSGIEAAIAANMDTAAIGHAANYNIANYNLKYLSDLLNVVL